MEQKPNFLGMLTKDFTDSFVKRVLPKPRKVKAGRPTKKMSWQEILERGSIAGKFALPGLAVTILMQKDKLTIEQATMVMHYVLEKYDELTVVDLYPASDTWVVRKAMEEFGIDSASDLSVGWDEIMFLAWSIISQWSQANAEAQAGLQPNIPDIAQFFTKKPPPKPPKQQGVG